MEKIRAFASVWDALEDDPAERASLTIRSSLMMALGQTIRGWKLPQKDAAARLGLTQPRLNDLLKGLIGKFSVDALVGIATQAGLNVTFKIKKAA